MTQINHKNLEQQATRILKKHVHISIEELGALVSEIKSQREQAGSAWGAKNSMKQERDDYKGRYYRILEGIASLREMVERVGANSPQWIADKLQDIEEQPDGPVTDEEARMLFGVEHRARRQEAANFELGKEIAAKIKRGASNGDVLDYLEKQEWKT